MASGSVAEVARAFLVLGTTAFGGPVAHLAHFRRELVVRREWLSEAAYAELVAYAQFLPGPTSSQVGFLLGYQRAGIAGALVAWSAFTLPSAILLTVLALAFAHGTADGRWLGGVKLAVLAIVAQAVVGMARSLCPDLRRRVIAVAATGLVLAVPGAWAHLMVLGPAALVGLWWCQPPGVSAPTIPQPSARLTVVVWTLLGLVVAGAIAGAWSTAPLAVLFTATVQAGGLVFGGGHVVLPLLREPLVQAGLVNQDSFLAGYAAAQVVPGPLFTVAAWLGAVGAGIPGAAVALVGIFAPGLLLALGGLGCYGWALARPAARGAVAGVNAGVVGILGGALIQPLGVEALHSPAGLMLAVAAYLALEYARIPAWAVIAGAALCTWAGWPT